MPQKRRSREEAALEAGGRGGDLPNNWLKKRGEGVAACGDWVFPTATDFSDNNESEVPESSIGIRPPRRRSAPARLCGENMVNDSRTETREKEKGTGSDKTAHENDFEGLSDDDEDGFEGLSHDDDCLNFLNTISMGQGRRIVDIVDLTDKLRSRALCRTCCGNKIKKMLIAFADFLVESNELISDRTPGLMVSSFLLSLNKSRHTEETCKAGKSWLDDFSSFEMIDEEMCGLASKLHFRCTGRKDGSNKHHFYLINSEFLKKKSEKSAPGPGKSTRRPECFKINLQATLGVLTIGKTGGDLVRLMTQLDIPVPPSFGYHGGSDRDYLKVETEIGDALKMATDQSCETALEKELESKRLLLKKKLIIKEPAFYVRPYLDKAEESGVTNMSELVDAYGGVDTESSLLARRTRGKSHQRGFYIKLVQKEDEKQRRLDEMVENAMTAENGHKKVDVNADGSWSQRGSNRVYNSNTGCVTAMGANNLQIIGRHSMTKNCDVCTRYRERNKVEIVPEAVRRAHACCENHHNKSSKSMEFTGMLAIANSLHDSGIDIDSICQDNDSSLRAHLKPKGSSTRVTKTCTIEGELPEDYEEIEFVIDLNHGARAMGKFAYEIFPNNGACTGIAATAKKYYTYCIKQGHENGDDPDTISASLRNAFGCHLFGIHDECGDWCCAKNNPNYRPHGLPMQKYLGERHRLGINKIMEKYCNPGVVSQFKPGRHTNANEGLHRLQTELAPKAVFWKNGTYDRRMDLAAGLYNDGYEKYMASVHDYGGMGKLSNIQKYYYSNFDRRKKRHRLTKQTSKSKRRRRFGREAMTKEALEKEHSEPPTYSSGMGFDILDSAGTNKRKECENCLGQGHSKRQCPHAQGVRKPGPLSATEVLTPGQVMVIYDFETTGKDVYSAKPVSFSMQTLVIQEGGFDTSNTKTYTTFIDPGIPIPPEATAVHGISDSDIIGKPKWSQVSVEIGKRILEASNDAGHVLGSRDNWLLGMNSNSFDMRIGEFCLSDSPNSWCGILRESRVVGVIDLMTLTKKPLSLFEHRGINGRSSQEKIYKALTGADMKDAHSADGDVRGLVGILTSSKSIVECMLSKKVGSRLEAWSEHHSALIARHEYEASQRKKWAVDQGKHDESTVLSHPTSAPLSLVANE